MLVAPRTAKVFGAIDMYNLPFGPWLARRLLGTSMEIAKPVTVGRVCT